ncbi:MAG: tetratricopeptide repeat protein [Bernardetiaceae bacterium]|jgi:serine phosphatase RsbU (regulator of sigma subunit)/tetratricopeptide (TPR) repeat protein|nr:tetratricopeptide repeat protein [Bernardetiaceae bacterium]
MGLTTWVFGQAVYAQPARIDSLTRRLNAQPDDTLKVLILCDLSFSYYSSDAAKAKAYGQQALTLAQQLKFARGEARAYNMIGVAYQYQDDYAAALDYHQKALTIREQTGDSVGMASSLNNMGIVFYSLKNFQRAKEYYSQSLKMRLNSGDPANVAGSYNNLGSTMLALADTGQAIQYFKLSREAARSGKRFSTEADALLNLGNTYRVQQRFVEAEEHLILALDLVMNLNDQLRLTYAYQYLAQTYLATKRTDQAKRYNETGLVLAQKGGFKVREADLLGVMSEIYEAQDQAKTALAFFKRKTHLHDSLTNLDRDKQVLEMQGRYNTGKQEAENERLREASAYQQQVNRWQQWAIGAALVGLLVVGGLALRLKAAGQKLRLLNNQLNERQQEISAQNEQLMGQQNQLAQRQAAIEKQNQQLDLQNRLIGQSIGVAQYIQSAILPSPARLADTLGEYFVLYQPKDVVSGDFFWVQQTQGRTLVVVADCTGHGVPGAFMALIGDALLDHFVLAERQLDPADLLQALNRKITHLFSQAHLPSEQANKFGMDAAVACLEPTPEGTRLTFAGAGRPLLMVQPGQPLQTWPALFRSLGTEPLADQPTASLSLVVPPGTMLYLNSDGYTDQCNPERQKFGWERLRAVLTEMAPQPAAVQQSTLARALAEFQQTEKQRDDILVLGLRV